MKKNLVSKKILVKFCISLIILHFNSCTYKKSEVKPVQICDTTNQISYETHIKPILDANCISCHSGSSPSGGVFLNSKTATVQAGDNYTLFHVVNRTNGYSQMPKNSDKLSECQIMTIKKWIKTGKN